MTVVAGTFPLRAVPRLLRILVVEDDPDVAALVKHVLERHGEMHVDIAADGELALRAVRHEVPDLMILDLTLPGVDGLEVCRLLRARIASANLPIIMLSARMDNGDQVSGLDLGADDYVTKPFSPRELAARVRAVLRRSQAQKLRTAIYRGTHLTADFEAESITVGGDAVRLTSLEFSLLRYLVEHRPSVISRGRLLEHVWRCDPSTRTRSVDVHVRRLRSKIGPAALQIETVVKSGYRFVD